MPQVKSALDITETIKYQIGKVGKKTNVDEMEKNVTDYT